MQGCSPIGRRRAVPPTRCGGTAVVVLVLFLEFASAAFAREEPLWNAAWITDTQHHRTEWVAALVTRVQTNRPKMLIHTGDTRFEWANRGAWEAVMTLLRIETPPIEFHLAPGNHDLTNGVLKRHLRRAATRGVYRLDTGRKAEGFGYYHNRVTKAASGPLWPTWNPEIVEHPAWQVSANEKPEHWQHPVIPYRYTFERGGIRFIVCDCFYTEDQREWVRDLITQPDDSSVSILLQHKHEVDDLAKYFAGLEGQHNVKLVLSGDHHVYCHEQRHGVTFITAAGIARGPEGENDAMTLWVYDDHLQLERYVLPEGLPMQSIREPETIWTCRGSFTQYERPEAAEAGAESEDLAASEGKDSRTEVAETRGPNLLYNGDFDNHVWYERSARRHWVEIADLSLPEAAVEMQVVALSRVCERGTCMTICSPVARLRLP